jgi:hypothetical protein
MRIAIVLSAAVLAVVAGCGGGAAPGLFSTGQPSEAEGGYTVLLATLTTPDHEARAETYKARTEKDTGWRGLFITSDTGHSDLCWGRYRGIEQARPNLTKAREYKTPIGLQAYREAMIVPLPGSDPGPVEWNLKNARGAYTVVIAKFFDVPSAFYYGRKQKAVDYCAELRQAGEEAYFLHGPALSTVSVGIFDESAIEMILSGQVNTPAIRDTRMLAALRRHPSLAVNGREQLIVGADPVTHQPKKVPEPSYPDRVPSSER